MTLEMQDYRGLRETADVGCPGSLLTELELRPIQFRTKVEERERHPFPDSPQISAFLEQR